MSGYIRTAMLLAALTALFMARARAHARAVHIPVDGAGRCLRLRRAGRRARPAATAARVRVAVRVAGRTPTGWLPPGRSAAVCLSIDDIHPGRSGDHYEAGGDLGAGVLGRIERLLDRHPQLRVTLFVTPDWREHSPVPTRPRLARVPLARDVLHLTPPLAPGTMRLDRHPAFVEYLRRRPRCEMAVHGLPPGPWAPSAARVRAHGRAPRAPAAAARAGDLRGLRRRGPARLLPPGWELPRALARALADEGFAWVSAARDIRTPVAPDARTAMSGPHGLRCSGPSSSPAGASCTCR